MLNVFYWSAVEVLFYCFLKYFQIILTFEKLFYKLIEDLRDEKITGLSFFIFKATISINPLICCVLCRSLMHHQSPESVKMRENHNENNFFHSTYFQIIFLRKF